MRTKWHSSLQFLHRSTSLLFHPCKLYDSARHSPAAHSCEKLENWWTLDMGDQLKWQWICLGTKDLLSRKAYVSHRKILGKTKNYELGDIGWTSVFRNRKNMSQGMGPSPFVLQTPVDPPQSTAATAKTATNANTATICYPTATANTAAATLLLLLMLLLLMLLLLLGFLQWRLSRKGMQRLPMCNWLPGWPLSLDYFFRDSQTLHQEC